VLLPIRLDGDLTPEPGRVYMMMQFVACQYVSMYVTYQLSSIYHGL
jgi:hypothetical protein